MSKVHFLGCGAGYYPQLGPTAAYFREGTSLYVLECGTSVFERLVQADAFRGVERVTVFLSHVHADHVGSLGILLDYCYDVLGIQPLLIHPQADVNELMRRMGVSPQAYHYAPCMCAADVDGVQAEFFSVRHAPDLSCYGYIITTADDCFSYSGDANDVPDAALAGLLAGRIRRHYQDTSAAVSDFHCGLSLLLERIPEALRNQVYCVHLNADLKDQILAAGFRLV